MKKFLTIALLCCLVGMPVWAATYNCQVQDIGTWSFKSSNEYLFVNVADYNHSNGKALVCGHMGTNGCDNGTMVFVTGSHYQDGYLRTDAWFYECSSSGGNSWDAVGTSALPQCSSLDGMEVLTTIADKYVYVPSAVQKRYALSGYYISDKFCWSEKQKSVAPAPVVVNPECPAGSSDNILNQKDCKSGERFECTKTGESNQCVCGKCIAGGGRDDGDDNSNGGGGSGVVGKCHPSVCKSEVCRECCKRPASETIWDRTAQVCQCVNGGKFQKENGAWICKVDAGAVVPEQGYVCDPVLLANLAKWRTHCVNKSDVLRQILELEEYCKGKPSKEVFLRLYDETFNSVKQCTETAETVVDDTAQKLKRSRAKITSAYNDLVGIAKGFKVSVWKNKEGNFNTARLASDSIAAVVLGTTGALVTSSIVKKNQVEGGFEDIKCTIGGQTVADWGDEFRVGIQ